MTDQPPPLLFADEPRRTHDVRYGLLFLIGLAVIAVALYAVGFIVAGNKIPSGTTIAGIDVGGMTPDEATTALQAELAPRIEQPIRAVAAGRTYSLNPQRAGLAYDIDASISSALRGSSWDPRHMLAVVQGGGDIEPALVVNQAELNSALGRIASSVKRAPRDAGVSFVTGGPQVRFGALGQELDMRRAKAGLVAAVRAGRRRVALPMAKVQPEVTDDEASTYARTVGRRAVTGSILLRVADATAKVTPGVFVPALTTRVTGAGLRLAVDPPRLYQRSRAVIAALPNSPVNARIRIGQRGRPVVVPGRRGSTVGQRAWAAGVLTALGRDARRARVTTTSDAPTFTSRDARRLRIRQLIGSDSVRLRSVPYADLARATRQLDGALLKPRDSFSFLGAVDAGSNQQAASLVAGATYTAAFRAGVTVPRRTPVVYDTGTFPRGLGARVVPPSRDLKLRNDSPYGVYISASARPLSGSGGVVKVDVWGSAYWKVVVRTSNRHSVVKPKTRVVRSGRCAPRRGIAGFEVDVTRHFWHSGKPVGSDVTRTRYAPLDRVKCR